VCGDGDEPYILDEADMRNADVVVAATGHDEDNLVVCLLGKLEYDVPLAIARINNPANEWLFTDRFGVDVPVSSTNVMFSLIESEVSLGDIITLLKLRADDMSIDELTLPADAGCVGKRLAELPLPPDTQVMVLIRAGKVVPPRGETVLAAGDELLILSPSGQEERLRVVFGVHAEPRL
jgi:trk system potassium uptake protein TrkA